MKRSRALAYGIAVAATASAAAMMTGVYEINWWTSDAGGGFSSGGTYDMGVDFGQVDYRVMSGGPYTIAGGFWPGAAEASDPTLIPTLLIRPLACPAPLNVDGHGVVKILMTGETGLDITALDLASVRIERADGIGGFVLPYDGTTGPGVVFADFNQPNDLDVGDGPEQVSCSCNDVNAPDGIVDVQIPFRTDDLVSELQLDGLPMGTEVALRLTGEFADGTPFVASDCMALVSTPGPPGMVVLGAEVNGVRQTGTWIDASPADLSLDGGGFGSFERCYSLDTIVTFTAPAIVNGVRLTQWRVDGQVVPASGPSGFGEDRNQETIEIEIIGDEHEVVAIYGGSDMGISR
ncbi:MAG: hypothetical protein GY716_06800 [bacterium]|nr:hypothetical protein [bacterium]